MTRCGDLMKLDPVCRQLTDSVQNLANAMKTSAVGPLPIVDAKHSNKLLGIVTYRDLVLNVLAADLNAVDTKALDVLSHEKQFCKSEDSISRAIMLMDRYHVNELPVIDNNMHLVGTILQKDITRRLEDPEIPLDAASLEAIATGEEVRTIL